MSQKALTGHFVALRCIESLGADLELGYREPMINNPHFSEVLFECARGAAADAGLPCIIAGKPKLVAAAAIYCEFWCCAGTPKFVDLDGPWRQTPGILQFTIYAPEGCESWVYARATRLRDLISGEIRLVGRLPFIETEELGIITLPGILHGKRITVVDGGFDFYEEVV